MVVNFYDTAIVMKIKKSQARNEKKILCFVTGASARYGFTIS